jgi:hypothetical protein
MREGMHTVEVDNEGLLVFLYDLSNREKISASDAQILHGLDVDASDDPALKELAAKGLLVVYELPQDDPVHLGVIVGEPLSTKEKKGAKWRKTQIARLSLPSGKLCVDSYNSLRFTDDTPSVPGATVDLPPGDYTLSLHRVDSEAAKSDGYSGPLEIVTLEPAKTVPKKAPPGVLPAGDEKRAPWDGKYKLTGSEFQGEVVRISPKFPAGGLSLNLGVGAARKLGLHRGSRLEVRIGGEQFDVFYHADINPSRCNSYLEPAYFESARRSDPALLRGWLDTASIMEELRGPSGFYRQTKVLRIIAWDQQEAAGLSGKFQSLTSLPPGTPVSVRVHSTPFAPPPDLGWVDRWAISDGALRAQVLLSTDESLYLNADEAAIRKLGFKFGKADELELKCGGHTRRVIDNSGLEGGELKAQEEKLSGTLDQKPLTIQFAPHWDLKRFIVVLRPLFFRKYAIGLSAAVGTPVDLRIKKSG